MLESRWEKIRELSKINNLTKIEKESLAYAIDLFNIVLDSYDLINEANSLGAFLNKIDNYLESLHYLNYFNKMR